MSDWSLLPPDDETPGGETSDEDVDTGDKDGDEEDTGDEGDGGAEGDSDGDDDPVELLRQENVGLKASIEDLRRSVGRAQSLANQFQQNQNDDDLRAQLRKQNRDTAEILSTFAENLDPTALKDPSLLEKIRQTRDQLQRADEREELLEQVRKEAGLGKTGAQPQPDEREQLQQQALSLEADLVTQIQSFDLDPDDEVFDWQEVKRLFLENPADRKAVYRYIGTQIRAAADAASSEDRREGRRSAASAAPRSSGPKVDKDPLESGTFAEGYEELRALGVIR